MARKLWLKGSTDSDVPAGASAWSAVTLLNLDSDRKGRDGDSQEDGGEDGAELHSCG